MIVESFNRRAVISRHVRERNSQARSEHTKGSLDGGIKFNTNLDPGFEGFGESSDVHLAAGLVAHFESTVESDDPILASAVMAGEYFQMAPLELRAEM